MTPTQRRAVQIYRIRLYALPKVDAVRALRAALKVLLRRFGLKVLSIEIEDAKLAGGDDDRRREKA
jgi:hypothetical protein